MAVWSSVVVLGTLVSAPATVLSGSSYSERDVEPLLAARLFPEAPFESPFPRAVYSRERPGLDITFELGHAAGSLNPVDEFLDTILRSGLTHSGTSDLHWNGGATNDPGRSEWEYLWRDPSCVPIHFVPEPTPAALFGAGALLWLHRKLRGK